MHAQQTIIARLIHAIGEPDFAAITAQSLRQLVEFDLVALVSHRRDGRAILMFDNFDVAGGQRGMENYIAATHAVNPILQYATHRGGVFRARDFSLRHTEPLEKFGPGVVRSADEELGFRTVGWPERLEEIGLYFDAMNATVELSLYRPRGRRTLDRDSLKKLDELRMPLAAAFNKHARLTAPPALAASNLTPREAEIAGLLLQGCGSPAIAARLGISRHTVKDHRKQIFRKLGIGSLGELFAVFRRFDP